MSRPDLDDRYGRDRSWQRPLTIGLSVLIAVVFGGWLAWTAWFHSTPEARSAVAGWQVESDHEVTARVELRLRDRDVDAVCRVRAYAEDHTTVGELNFDPVTEISGERGTATVTIRTERRATSVENVGCTSADQRRPR